jgi:hypothetical protein
MEKYLKYKKKYIRQVQYTSLYGGAEGDGAVVDGVVVDSSVVVSISNEEVLNLDAFIEKATEQYTEETILKSIDILTHISSSDKRIVIFFHANGVVDKNITMHCFDGTTSAVLIHTIIKHMNSSANIIFEPVTHSTKDETVKNSVNEGDVVIFADIFVKDETVMLPFLSSKKVSLFVWDHHRGAISSTTLTDVPNIIYPFNVKLGISGILLLICIRYNIFQQYPPELLLRLAFISLGDMWNIDPSFGVIWDSRDVMDIIKKEASLATLEKFIKPEDWITFLLNLPPWNEFISKMKTLWEEKWETFEAFTKLPLREHKFSEKDCILVDKPIIGGKEKLDDAAIMRILEIVVNLGLEYNPFHIFFISNMTYDNFHEELQKYEESTEEEKEKNLFEKFSVPYKFKEVINLLDPNFLLKLKLKKFSLRYFGNQSDADGSRLSKLFGGGGHNSAAGGSNIPPYVFEVGMPTENTDQFISFIQHKDTILSTALKLYSRV